MPSRTFLPVATLALALVVPSMPSFAQAWGQGASAPVSGDCDPVVQRRQDDMARSYASRYTELAGNMYTPMLPSGFTGVSCIDRLMNSSFDIFLGGGNLNLDQILAQIVGGACQLATSFIQDTVSNLAYSSQGLNLGEVIPGVSLGSVGGFSMRPNIGGSTTGSPVNIISSGSGFQSGNLSGYWGGSPGYDVPSYGSIMGPSGAYRPQSAGGSGGWLSGITNFWK